MKNHILIAMIILPLGFISCKEKNTPTTKMNEADTSQTADTIEESPEEVVESSPDLSGASLGGIIGNESSNELEGAAIGAAAGGIIGHQSGSALEGAAIGAALGGAPINEEVDEPNEE